MFFFVIFSILLEISLAHDGSTACMNPVNSTVVRWRCPGMQGRRESTESQAHDASLQPRRFRQAERPVDQVRHQVPV